MVKKQHRVMSLILCLLLAISTVFVGTIGAFATTGDTVYVRANNGWTDLYCYMWSDGSGSNANWPGVKMTKVEDDVYSYTLSGDYNKVIFNNNGGGSKQTADLDYPGSGKIYDLSNGTWSDYKKDPTTPTSPTTPVTTAPVTQPTTTPLGEGTTVYLQNDNNWSTPYVYMWNSGSDSNHAWPGVAMTSIGDGVYTYVAPKEFKNCIFSNNGQSQTSDLTAKNGYIYNNKTGEWSIYDVNPLQVKSFSVNPETGIYKDSDLVISSLAHNVDGAEVSYKFSVKNSSGATTVLSDFSSTNSITWSPSAVGDYTIVFDFKDTEGNSNTREKAITVSDDSSLVNPVIKGVTPADLNLIKLGAKTTVSVKAGGGKTGTNLLFYKYVVTDPNGVKNTPYYTLNNTYSFVPETAGTYKVQVFVQGSDNTTINKTYTYTATGDVTDPTTQPTQPTTAKPTQPTTAKPTQPTTAQPTQPTTPVVIKGDVNGDGVVNVDDASYLQKVVAEFPGFTTTLEVGDMDNDGEITIKDVTVLQKYIVENV